MVMHLTFTYAYAFLKRGGGGGGLLDCARALDGLWRFACEGGGGSSDKCACIHT